MLIKVTKQIIYNTETGRLIELVETEHGQELWFDDAAPDSEQGKLGGKYAEQAWGTLCAVARAERRVLELQHEKAYVEADITNSFEP